MQSLLSRPADQAAMNALQEALDGIERSCGSGSIMKLAGGAIEPVEAIPTGSYALNAALGVGGLPIGRIIEIYGPEASGKTTLCYHAIAAVQQAGHNAAFIDTEHAMDPQFARRIGVDLDNLLLSQPDTAEQALEIADRLCCSGAVRLIVVDSVAALVPKAELDGEMGDTHIGLQARLMSQAMRKLKGVARENNCTLLFTNQLREKIGIKFGNPETTPGGRALKFYASVRLDVRRVEAVKDGQEIVGMRSRVKVVKNKVAPPFKEAFFTIRFDRGIDRIGELIELGVEAKVIDKSGSHLSFNGERLGQGRAQAHAAISADPALGFAIEQALGELIA
jgi:recombination protein RecA